MGCFNTYNGVQLRIHQYMDEYHLGEEVDIEDGVYVAWEGVVVVVNKKLVATFPRLFDKWGGIIECESLLKNMRGEF